MQRVNRRQHQWVIFSNGAARSIPDHGGRDGHASLLPAYALIAGDDAHYLLHDGVQRDRVFAAQVQLKFGALCDRVDGGAASDHAHVEGGARRFGRAQMREVSSQLRQHMHGAGCTKVAPAMSTGRGDLDAVAPRCQRLMHHARQPHSLNHDGGADSRWCACAELIDGGAHAAQITVAFFPDVGNKPDVNRWLLAVNGLGQPEQRGHTQ